MAQISRAKIISSDDGMHCRWMLADGAVGASIRTRVVSEVGWCEGAPIFYSSLSTEPYGYR